jgi:Protein of unknown function (DUF2009)
VLLQSDTYDYRMVQPPPNHVAPTAAERNLQMSSDQQDDAMMLSPVVSPGASDAAGHKPFPDALRGMVSAAAASTAADSTLDDPSEAVPSCVECEDQTAELVCLSCGENYCRPCWGSLHRRGARANHRTEALLGALMPAPVTQAEPSLMAVPPTAAAAAATLPVAAGNSAAAAAASAHTDAASEDTVDDDAALLQSGASQQKLEGYIEACRYIPLRVTAEERQLLQLLEAALNVSEYTDKVDVVMRFNKRRVIQEELEHMLATMSGLAVAGNVLGGEKLIGSKSLADNADFFAKVFEVGRRSKIANPSKMRGTYGKMMFMLQDAEATKLDISLVNDVKMVTTMLEQKGPKSLQLLEDRRLLLATQEVTVAKVGRDGLAAALAAKKQARAALIEAHSSAQLSAAEIDLVVESINDANNYLECNMGPVATMLQLLRTNFDKHKYEDPYSLALKAQPRYTRSSGFGNYSSDSYSSSGFGFDSFNSLNRSHNSAKLCHDHPTQYTFVTQSLRLWTEAMRCMYRLWLAADSDLLSGRATYRLCNTGQGLNRVQSCPSVSSQMRRVLNRVQSECGAWVGLSVVHLGKLYYILFSIMSIV